MPNEQVGVVEKKKSELKVLKVKVLRSKKGNLYLRAFNRKDEPIIGVWCNPKHVHLDELFDSFDEETVPSHDFYLDCFYGVAKEKDKDNKPLLFLNFVKSVRRAEPVPVSKEDLPF